MTSVLMNFDGREPLTPAPARPGIALRERYLTKDLVLGEWSLTAAAWTDRHQHEEINLVLEGELHVTYGGTTHVATVGTAVAVPAGELARYEAPTFARMMFIYGPSQDGHAASDVTYEDPRCSVSRSDSDVCVTENSDRGQPRLP